VHPILLAIELIAAHCDSCSAWCSNTIRTARSRTSGEYFCTLFMTPILSSVGVSGKPGAVHRIDYREDRSVCADAKRQRDDSDQREARFLRQHTGAVAQVLPKVFDPSHAPRVATPLLRLLHTAETFQRCSPRVFRIHTQADVLLGLLFDVIAQFLI